MRITNVLESESISYIVRATGVSVLIVHSAISELNFTSNTGIIKVDNPDPGEYRIHLNPGTSIVTFKSEGYSPAKMRFYIVEKQYKEVRVKVDREVKNIVKSLIELRLPSGDIYIEQDSLPLGIVTVPLSGILSFRVNPGNHEFTLLKQGYAEYTMNISVKEGEVITKDVDLNLNKNEAIPVTVRNTGVLVVRSEPGNANVFIDGVEVGQTTFQMKQISVGEHVIAIEKPLYRAYNEFVNITPGEIVSVEAMLEPNFAELSIKSDPPGAQIYINNTPLGFTPFENVQQVSGTYSLLLSKWMYHDHEQKFIIEAGKNKTINVNMKERFGHLLIRSEPPDAQVLLNQKLIGKTPIRIDSLLSNSYTLIISKEFYIPHESKLQIEDGKLHDQMIRLIPNFGIIKILSSPEGKDVFLDNSSITIGKTPISTRLLIGRYNITVKDDLYEDNTNTVIIEVGKTEIINTELVRKRGTLIVFTEPPDAEIIIDGKSRGLSPIRLSDYPTGTYTVEARKNGYSAENKSVNINYKMDEEITITLSEFGRIEIKTDPPMAEFYLDGKYKGTSPIIIRDLEEGKYEIEARKDGFNNASSIVNVKNGQVYEVNLKLLQGGSLDVSSSPSNTLVYLDGKKMGKTPLTINGVKKGSHSLKLSKFLYEDYETTIWIEDGKSNDIDHNFLLKQKYKYKALSIIVVDVGVELNAPSIGSLLGSFGSIDLSLGMLSKQKLLNPWSIGLTVFDINFRARTIEFEQYKVTLYDKRLGKIFLTYAFDGTVYAPIENKNKDGTHKPSTPWYKRSSIFIEYSFNSELRAYVSTSDTASIRDMSEEVTRSISFGIELKGLSMKGNTKDYEYLNSFIVRLGFFYAPDAEILMNIVNPFSNISRNISQKYVFLNLSFGLGSGILMSER